MIILWVFLSLAMTVIDGDTFAVDDGEKIRLIGIDCPESGRWYADQATALLDSLLSDKELRFEYGNDRNDRYGRTLAYVYVDDTLLINLELIKRGVATALLRYPHGREAQFLDAELIARRAGVGMWGSTSAGLKTTAAAVLPQTEVAPTLPKREPIDETVYITKSGSKYHRAGCSYLKKSKIPISKKDAIARGYTPCSKCRP